MHGSTISTWRAMASRVFLVTIWIACVPILAFILLEGGSSLVLLLWALRLPAESLHTQYDPELGWAANPTSTSRICMGRACI